MARTSNFIKLYLLEALAAQYPDGVLPFSLNLSSEIATIFTTTPSAPPTFILTLAALETNATFAMTESDIVTVSPRSSTDNSAEGASGPFTPAKAAESATVAQNVFTSSSDESDLSFLKEDSIDFGDGHPVTLTSALSSLAEAAHHFLEDGDDAKNSLTASTPLAQSYLSVIPEEDEDEDENDLSFLKAESIDFGDGHPVTLTSALSSLAEAAHHFLEDGDDTKNSLTTSGPLAQPYLTVIPEEAEDETPEVSMATAGQPSTATADNLQETLTPATIITSEESQTTTIETSSASTTTSASVKNYGPRTVQEFVSDLDARPLILQNMTDEQKDNLAKWQDLPGRLAKENADLREMVRAGKKPVRSIESPRAASSSTESTISFSSASKNMPGISKNNYGASNGSRQSGRRENRIGAVKNAPVQLHRRKACDSQGKDILIVLTRTGHALRNLEDEYNRWVQNPLLRPTFNRAQKDLDTITSVIKDEVGDPIPERSSGKTLDQAKADFQQVIHQLRYGLENMPQLAQDLDGFMTLSRNVDTYIDELSYCCKKASYRNLNLI
ncbi:hypothetical protein KI688_007705 [Linnemannia hyalina]|uniref:Uncharacterized protein n=1 Tax=Linnemannia hyalina TaxID=64524 RepID=A0A9P8BMT2_9FUNG|nr:hypothetical protein KI688_007705 [Linnemannia hyalina]